MPGVEVDGNDVAGGMREPPARRSSGPAPAAGRRCSSARPTAPGPHAEGMGDFTYRTREEVEEWKTRCPIRRPAELLDRSGDCRAKRTRRGSTPRSADKCNDSRQGRRKTARGRTRRPRRSTSTRRLPRDRCPRPCPPDREVTFMQATLEALARDGGRPDDLRPGRRHRRARRQLQDDRAGCTTCTARSGCATRRSASAASSAWRAARR